MRTKELCWWHLTFGCFPARPSCPHRGSLSGWGVSLRILINVLILDWKPNYPNPHHVSINLHLEKTSTSRPQNLHHHLTWIQLQDLVSLIQILKWIYSACMSWSEKGQLTSERKQTTARDKTRSDHSSDIASLWTVTHQDGFCVWIRCCYILARCICPTIQLYLWDDLTLFLHITVVSVTYQDGNKVGTNYFVIWGVICIWYLGAGIGLSLRSDLYLWQTRSLCSVCICISALVCHKSRCKIVLNVLFGWLHLKHLVVKGEKCAGR